MAIALLRVVIKDFLMLMYEEFLRYSAPKLSGADYRRRADYYGVVKHVCMQTFLFKEPMSPIYSTFLRESGIDSSADHN